MTIEHYNLGDLISPATVDRAGTSDYPILSMTMNRGLVLQGEKFKKRIASADTSAYKVVKQGQLVVGFPIDEGVLAFQEITPIGIVSPAYDVWDIDTPQPIQARYLERFLRSPIALSYYRSKLRSTTARRRSLPRELFLDLQVPILEISEQNRVADILDQVDSLRERRIQTIGLLDELTQSVFLDMFGNPATNPKCWPIRTVGELVRSATYGTSQKATQTGDLPVLRMGNVTPSGRIDMTNLKYLDSSTVGERHLVRSGDVLFNRTNSVDLVGKTAVCRESQKLAYAGYLVRVRTDQDCDPEYLSAFLNSQYGKRVLRGMSKSIVGMANINARELQSVRIPAPPLTLQREFAERIQSVESQRSRFESDLPGLGELFVSLQGRAFRDEL